MSNQTETKKLDRFKCAICDDFDFCKFCLNEPKLKRFKCANHKKYKHEFIKWQRSSICSGYLIYGECKSKNKEIEKDEKYYKCLKCYDDFILCESCFNEPKLIEYKSSNHPHPFKLYSKLDEWLCDGSNVFFKCKLNLDDNASGHIRYRCTVCDDFDFCEGCFKEPKLEEHQNPNHNHQIPLVEYSTNQKEKLKCAGFYLFGKCKMNINDSNDQKMYGCPTCRFQICSECFKEPKIRSDYTTPNHEHLFFKKYNQKNFLCDGDNIFDLCLLGKKRKNGTLYECTECDFILCEFCFEAPEKSNLTQLENYQEIDLSVLFDEI